MGASRWLVIGGVWLAAVVLSIRFRPAQFGHVWQATGAKRFWMIFTIYVLGLLYQVFVLGWLIPVGVGIYKLVRK
jgi:hypothetical protein